MPVLSNRLSRWTPLIFFCALINFALAQSLAVAGMAWPTVSFTNGMTLIVVHLITIGWLTLLMFGALFQFVPVITGKKLPSQWLSLLTLILVEFGLIGMVIGFFSLGSGHNYLLDCLPVGGTLVLLGSLFAVSNVAIPLLTMRPLALPGRFVMYGLGFLAVTVLLGLTFALMLSGHILTSYFIPILRAGVGYHMLAGLGGWFTLTAIGVSYKLLPMFMLAPEERGWWGMSVLMLAAAGFVITVGAGLLRQWLPQTRFLDLFRCFGWFAIEAAVVVYLIDVVRMYSKRKRKHIELHNRAAIGAFLSLDAALLLVLFIDFTHSPSVRTPALVLLVLFGWLSGLGLTQLYKIVPFLTWITHYGHRLGRGKVPRVQDLVNETHAWPWFAVYFLGVVIASIAAFSDIPYMCRLGLALTLLATLGLMHEYWRAWRSHYTGRVKLNVPKTQIFLAK